MQIHTFHLNTVKRSQFTKEFPSYTEKFSDQPSITNLFFLILPHIEEEERACWKNNSMRLRIRWSCQYNFAILVPGISEMNKYRLNKQNIVYSLQTLSYFHSKTDVNMYSDVDIINLLLVHGALPRRIFNPYIVGQ